MANKWKQVTVGSLVRADIIDRPIDGNHGAIHPKGGDFVASGIPFIMASDLNNGCVDIEHCAFITLAQAKNLRKGFAKKGDVLLSHKATIGRTAIVGSIPYEFIILTPQVTYYRVKNYEILNNQYLKYYFDSEEFQQVLHAWSGKGSTRAYLGITDQLNLPILLPPINEQRAIAHTLGSLDDKIELNRRMNETLEAMAQALFKSWFVDFDPVIDNALAAGKPIPDDLQPRVALRESLGDARKPLPEEMRKLFPEEFALTEEMGWIPKGWLPVSVDNAITINPSTTLKQYAVAPYVDMKALPTSGFSVMDIEEKPYSGGAKFIQGDVLLARITPCLENGKTGLVDFLDGGEIGFGSTEFIVLRERGALRSPFIACLSRTAAFREHCAKSMVGSSGRQRVQNACFLSYHLPIPPGTTLLRAFDQIARPYFTGISKHSAQSMTLVKLRDILLPKLLSGELRISVAETMVVQNIKREINKCQ